MRDDEYLETRGDCDMVGSFLLGVGVASVVWLLGGLWLYRLHQRTIQAALNLPSASSLAHLKQRLHADKAFKRGPWR